MPEKISTFYFEDILESIEKIRRYLGKASFDEFLENEMLIDAVIRNLEIIGEAAAHISPEICVKYSEIEWKKIVGLRNILIHDYSGIDIEIVWDIIQNRLDLLEAEIRQALNKEKGYEDQSSEIS
ncbi:DUF86 domain-containing protein [Methanosarcina sp. MSH10X1]|uniref:HepT-like ribonuclease domain-containing protein n=1 Tax=Methanosarcina sp. MSH10X1 TaxID=2507075 RepID=UPI000FFC723B|nr:DUF86 domain-containing protein [Methanosarcina sp. MSH10X1]RXA21203.1 DUF86 domain-containing protein [Methanosarcina sp. MSH10X1]